MPVEIPLDRLDLARYIRSGDTVVWGQGTGEPLSLTEALVAQRHGLGRVNIFLGTSFSDTLRPEHADVFGFSGIAGIGSNRKLTKAGHVFHRVYSSADALEGPRAFREKRPPVWTGG